MKPLGGRNYGFAPNSCRCTAAEILRVHDAAQMPAPDRTANRTRFGPLRLRRGPMARSAVEFDVLVKNDIALVVLDDVVTMQAVALVVEVVLTFGAGDLRGCNDLFADLLRIGGASLVDRSSQHRDRVVGPRTLVIRRNLIGIA